MNEVQERCSHVLRASPFSIVADEASAACWAGPDRVLRQLERLRRTWSNRSDSTLDLIWANLGAGKTHALFHLRHLLRQAPGAVAQSNGGFVAYVEIPDQLSRFIDLYRAIAPMLPLRQVAEFATKNSSGIGPGLLRASRALAFGDEGEQRLAHEWLCGGRPGLRELKSVTGIDARIESDVDAERTLSQLVRICAAAKQRVVLLLDEFQRIGHLGARTREALMSHLRALFSHNATYLSVVVAVGSRLERTATELLPAELKTIMGMRPPISLPAMDKEEGIQFLLRRLAWYRPDGYSGASEAPFNGECIQYVLTYMVDRAHVPLIPRTILQVFGIIYDEILESGEVPSYDCLKNLLDSLHWDAEQAE